jgi:leucyl aminopeptidase
VEFAVPYTRVNNLPATPLLPLDPASLEAWLPDAPPSQAAWVGANAFKARPGSWCVLPDTQGELEKVLFGVQKESHLYQLAKLSTGLPPGHYRLDSDWDPARRAQAALGWGLAAYRFDRYRKRSEPEVLLQLEDDIFEQVAALYDAQCVVRDLVNTPTEDLGPEQLADAVRVEADEFGARVHEVVGDELLEEGFPAIHAVGRAAVTPPRFITLSWGNPDHPLLALAGKGVCFDSGGLDIKNAAGMSLMKKDMGGAAHAPALARLVMQHQLPLNLLLVIPAVENAIAGNAYRPGDVIRTRKGLTIEIGNTDAEGRVVLADALAYACEQEPDLLLDFATLTGAARIAMGPDLPPVFSNDRELAKDLVASGDTVEDPLWELPLYAPYRSMIDSDIADISNSGKSSYGGCITAALFLQEFVTAATPWAHFDTFAWNQTSRPGRPAGGEALGLRAAWAYLKERYA